MSGITVSTIDLPTARRLALSVVLGQAALTVSVAFLSWALADARAALSALLGGGIGTAGSLAMVLLIFAGVPDMAPQRFVRAFFIGELVKLVVVIALLIVVLRLIKVSPAAMLCAYAASFLVYWAVLAMGLPAAAAMRRPRAERS